VNSGVFAGCSSLTSITLPSSVTSIGSGAFNSCRSLTSITIPSSISSIGSSAFSYCSSLTSITLPNSVTSIGEYAFNGCNSLGSIIIPSYSGINISQYAFYGCSNLVIYFSELNGHQFGEVTYLYGCPVVWGVPTDTIAPSYLISQISNNIVHLAWQPPTTFSFHSFVGYAIYRDGELLSDTDITNPSFTDAYPISDSHDYFVTAIYTTGESTPSNTINVSILFLPKNLSINVDYYSVSLSWESGYPDRYSRSFMGYKVYRDNELLTEEPINNTSYAELTIPPGIYTYKVSAIYSGGESDKIESGNVIVYDIQPPENLLATTTEIQSVRLNWQAPTSAGVTHYKVYSKTSPADEFTMIHQSENATTLTYDDPAVLCNGTTYYYRVTASYPTGESEPLEISITPAITVPWSENFVGNDLPTNWTNDGGWVFSGGYVYSSSDNMLITPLLQMLGTPMILTYEVWGSSSVSTDYEILIARHGQNLANIYSGSVLGLEHQLRYIDLSAFAEEMILLAFRNYGVGGILCLDNVSVKSLTLTPPTNLQATITQTPSVVLNWEVPEAEWVIQYKIYRKIGNTGEFVLLPQVINHPVSTYEDIQVEIGVTYQYYVTAVYPTGESEPSDTVSVTPVSDADIISVAVTRLKGNYPNPFNPTTTISYNMAREGHVSIEVYNSKGQRVRILVDDMRSVGSHSVVWDGRDMSGGSVASGVYFYRMTTDGYSSVRKMLLMK